MQQQWWFSTRCLHSTDRNASALSGPRKLTASFSLFTSEKTLHLNGCDSSSPSPGLLGSVQSWFWIPGDRRGGKEKLSPPFYTLLSLLWVQAAHYAKQAEWWVLLLWSQLLFRRTEITKAFSQVLRLWRGKISEYLLSLCFLEQCLLTNFPRVSKNIYWQ